LEEGGKFPFALGPKNSLGGPTHEIILNPPKNWKKITHDKIDETWINKWSEEAGSKSTLQFME
jgi:hypothetical protein